MNDFNNFAEFLTGQFINVQAQTDCSGYDTDWTNCVIAAYTKGACTGDSWCQICNSLYTEYANCTCFTELDSWKPSCIQACTNMEVCAAQSAYNSTMSCTAVNNVYTDCVEGLEQARPAYGQIPQGRAVVRTKINH